jgi:hypothetical protein
MTSSIIMRQYTMQTKSIETLLSGVMAASGDSNIDQPKKLVVQKFREAFSLFAKCHNVYNGKITTDATITQFGRARSFLYK